MLTNIEVGQLVVYDREEYDVLDKTPDGNLLLGKDNNVLVEVCENNKVFLKNENGLSGISGMNFQGKKYSNEKRHCAVIQSSTIKLGKHQKTRYF